MEECAAQFDFRLANVGNCPTCIRPQSSSIIDFTWVSPGLIRRVREWRVRHDILSLSNHLYITFCVSEVSAPNRSNFVDSRPRWNFKKANLDLFCAAIEWSCALIPQDEDFFLNVGPDRWQTVDNACFASVPRVCQRRSGSQVYWWNDDIWRFRRSAIKVRRTWMTDRHRLSPQTVADLRRAYGGANRLVKKEIRKAKTCAWRELLATLYEDPWGLPYKIVLKRLKRSSPGLTMILEPTILERLLSDLFPTRSGIRPIPLPNTQWTDDLGFSSADIARALGEKKNPNTAPGPDGFKAVVWKKVPAVMLHCFAGCFIVCMKHGIFPSRWLPTWC